MKKIIFLLFFLSFGIYFSQINVEEIKKNVTENPQKYFYEYLERFIKNPSKLSQEEMNQLYYGSRFVETGYTLSNFNDDYKEIWKLAEKRNISKAKAQKIFAKAEAAYLKNPLEKEISTGMYNIYRAMGDEAKSDNCALQYEMIYNTIEKSGTGNSEDSPICVIKAGDMIKRIDGFSGMGGGFSQKMKDLPDGSLLNVYSMGDKKIYVKLVGGFR